MSVLREPVIRCEELEGVAVFATGVLTVPDAVSHSHVSLCRHSQAASWLPGSLLSARAAHHQLPRTPGWEPQIEAWSSGGTVAPQSPLPAPERGSRGAGPRGARTARGCTGGSQRRPAGWVFQLHRGSYPIRPLRMPAPTPSPVTTPENGCISYRPDLPSCGPAGSGLSIWDRCRMPSPRKRRAAA